MEKGRFLGINWSAGDVMTFYIETEKDPGEGLNVVQTRNNARSRASSDNSIPSGEIADEYNIEEDISGVSETDEPEIDEEIVGDSGTNNDDKDSGVNDDSKNQN